MSKVALLFLAIVILEAVETSDAQNRLSNVYFLGLGYNVLKGNPHAQLRDPGFVEPVVALRYNEGLLTDDNKWRVPDKTIVRHVASCAHNVESVEIHGASSYRDALSTEVSISTGAEFAGIGAKFSVSKLFAEVRAGTNEQRNVYVISEARCVMYQVYFRRRATVEVTPDFAGAVDQLPTEVNASEAIDAVYLEFLSTFGTHYVSDMDMGAKVIIRSEFSQDAWTSLTKSHSSIKVSASASFGSFFNTGSSVSNSKDKDLADSFNRARTDFKVSYIGRLPPDDGRWETWARSTEDTPYPIKYELKPLTSLLTTRYFPRADEKQLAVKLNLLNASFSAYCRSLPGCGIPDPDRIPVLVDRVEKEVFKIATQVSCNFKYSLLSCGIDNLVATPSGKKWEYNRAAIPVSATSCECFDYHGARCVAWCSDTVKGFQTAIAKGTVPTSYWGIRHVTSTFGVTCSPGKKVIGCHIEPRRRGNPDRLRSYYPVANGTGCTCRDEGGGNCLATCAEGIRDYEIVSQFARGVITVRCSKRENLVLGCGVQAHSSDEKWRTANVAPSRDACQCYDKFGATCYAICGQFI